MMIKKRAFSLTELSVVILIIGILISGLLVASRLYKESKFSVAQMKTNSAPVTSIENLELWLETTSKLSLGNDQTQEGADCKSKFSSNFSQF